MQNCEKQRSKRINEHQNIFYSQQNNAISDFQHKKIINASNLEKSFPIDHVRQRKQMYSLGREQNVNQTLVMDQRNQQINNLDFNNKEKNNKINSIFNHSISYSDLSIKCLNNSDFWTPYNYDYKKDWVYNIIANSGYLHIIDKVNGINETSDSHKNNNNNTLTQNGKDVKENNKSEYNKECECGCANMTNKEKKVVKEKFNLVLDLDNTLINATRLPTANTTFTIVVGRRKFYVQARPGLQKFLEAIDEHYDIYFFTASEVEYAKAIISKIAPSVSIEKNDEANGDCRCFTRKSCAFSNGYEVKDLRLLMKPLETTVLIDDIQGSCLLQPLNSIVVPPFYGDVNDNILIDEILPLLLKCKEAPELLLNIRKYTSELAPHILLYYQ